MQNLSSKLFEIFSNVDSAKNLIANIDTKVVKYCVDNHEVISTIVDEIKPNCYVVSVNSMLIEYSKDELIKLDSKIVRTISYMLIKLFENKSKYIEWLIYEDMKKHLSEDELKNIFI